MTASSSSVSVSSSVTGSGGTLFASKSRGGTSRMATGRQIGRAYALTLHMTLRPLPGIEGRVAIGPYQGSPRGDGYRFVVLTGAASGDPAFLLERQSGGAGETLASYDGPLRIEDGEEREILWTRDAGGEMTVSIGGEEILRATDRDPAGPFDGIVLLNSGGDVEVGAVEVGDPD